MKVDVLQHVAFEGPAAIEKWAIQNGHELIVYRLDQGERVPAVDGLELLIVLGGPMSVNDEQPNWIRAERELIQKAILLHIPILGICLGAQQIAYALGANISQGTKEVGWHKIDTVSDLFSFIPPEMTVFHWHGEQFAIPDGAERLFSSEACFNQGFVYQQHVIGLQFHFESTKDSVALLLQHDADYLDNSAYVQDAETIQSFEIPEVNLNVLYQLLDELVKTVADVEK